MYIFVNHVIYENNHDVANVNHYICRMRKMEILQENQNFTKRVKYERKKNW